MRSAGCGGFDFRFAIDVLPEPEMHVDLGDFRFLAAQNAAGDVVSLLVSRTLDQGFVQVTTVSARPDAPGLKVSAAAAPAVSEPTTEPEATIAPADLAPVAERPAATGSLTEGLLQAGAVALDDLVFASGSADLADQDYPSLAQLADWLKANPDKKVTLVGHTDASGTLAGNVSLSKARAASVRAFLIKRYAAAGAQIDAQGAGFLAPRASNQTPEGRKLNRRVEVMLSSLP